MRIRSCLIVTAAVVAALSSSLGAAGPAGAATRTEGLAAGSALSPATQRQLLTLFAKDRDIPAADIASIAPAAVLGPQASSGRDWTMVSFRPTSHASLAVKVKFQDGAGTGVFTQTAGHAWALAGAGGEPAGCAVSIPQPVRRAWHLPSCQPQAGPLRSATSRKSSAESAGTISDLVNIALAQVGVSDNPPSVTFSPDCNPYTTLVGNPDGAADCGTTTSNGSWFSNVENANELWCADFTKWVWERAGVTSDLGTLNPSAASFYTWGVDHGEHISLGGTPEVGDAVLFYPPGTTSANGSYADHVGIVASINSDGSVNLVDGDFLGSTNISVQYNADVPGPSWYASGEEWAFVSPQLQGTVAAANSPSVAVSSTGSAYVFWEGTDGNLWEGQGPAAGALAGPYNRGMGPLGSTPAAAINANGDTYVYWRGTGPNHDLWEAYWNGKAWVGPYNRGMGPLGSAPSVAMTRTGTAYVFWEGTDGDLWEAQGPGDGALAGPYNRGMGPLGSAPTAGVNASGDTYVYWRGTGPNHDLWEGYWNGKAWVGPYNRGMGPLGSAPSVAVTSTGTAYVFWEGTDGNLWEAQGPADGALAGPYNHHMGPLGSGPTAGVNASGDTYAYWRGSSPDHDLWEGYWNGKAWVGPYNRGMGPLS
jgi:hypothetical protein